MPQLVSQPLKLVHLNKMSVAECSWPATYPATLVPTALRPPPIGNTISEQTPCQLASDSFIHRHEGLFSMQSAVAAFRSARWVTTGNVERRLRFTWGQAGFEL